MFARGFKMNLVSHTIRSGIPCFSGDSPCFPNMMRVGTINQDAKVLHIVPLPDSPTYRSSDVAESKRVRSSLSCRAKVRFPVLQTRSDIRASLRTVAMAVQHTLVQVYWRWDDSANGVCAETFRTSRILPASR